MSGVLNGPGGQAAYDQGHAQALEALRDCTGFFLATCTRDGDDYLVSSLCGGRNILDATAVLTHAPDLAADYLGDLIDGIVDFEKDAPPAP